MTPIVPASAFVAAVVAEPSRFHGAAPIAHENTLLAIVSAAIIACLLVVILRHGRRWHLGKDPVQLGIGVSTFTEMCGLAPSRVLGSLAYGAGGWEHAAIRMLPTGKVEVVTGSSAHGQGHETAWSQIVADQLGVPFEDIRVLHGDTQVSPKGMDTYGSRSLAVGGMALVSACDKVIEKARVIASSISSSKSVVSLIGTKLSWYSVANTGMPSSPRFPKVRRFPHAAKKIGCGASSDIVLFSRIVSSQEISQNAMAPGSEIPLKLRMTFSRARICRKVRGPGFPKLYSAMP